MQNSVQLLKSFLLFFTLIVLTMLYMPSRSLSLASEKTNGEEVFFQHCSGCHIKGGNIIRRGKTLKLSALNKNGIDSPEAIAKIASQGIGSMSGYKGVLKEGEDQLVGEWIWEQAQNAWIHG